MRTIKLIMTIAVIMVLAHSCKEDLGITKPLYDDGVPPGEVTVHKVENISGGAVIYYDVPKDLDLQYVKASYEIRPGIIRETKISKLSDTISVNGFMGGNEYVVLLTAYDIGENASSSVEVKVHPTRSPIELFADSLLLNDDFGGMALKITNPRKEKFLLKVYEDVRNDVSVLKSNIFVESEKRTFNIRGYKGDSLVNFSVNIIDDYGNQIGPIKKKISPYEEVIIDRNIIRPYRLPSDISDNGSYPLGRMFDGNKTNFYHSITATALPVSITFDIGKVAQFSRFKYYQRTGFFFNHNNFKFFEIYGSNNPVDDWEFWTLIGEYESRKPSGNPLGSNTAEDDAYANAGEDFNVDAAPAFRYYRIKVIETWGVTLNIQSAEMEFWGKYVE